VLRYDEQWWGDHRVFGVVGGGATGAPTGSLAALATLFASPPLVHQCNTSTSEAFTDGTKAMEAAATQAAIDRFNMCIIPFIVGRNSTCPAYVDECVG